MKIFIPFIIFVVLLLFVDFKKNPANERYKIYENGKVGYINSTGEIVVKPKFLAGGEFSEGLAPVRLNGLYGYIDIEGQWVIEPSYDYAQEFSEGIAIAYIDGNGYYFDKKGNRIFEHELAELNPFKDNQAKIKTHSDKYGVINNNGELVIDTLFSSIGEFKDERSVVIGLNHKPTRKKGEIRKYEIGVINKAGNFIVPYGKFSEIGEYSDGYYKVRIPAEKWDTIEGYSAKTGFINSHGEVLFIKSFGRNIWVGDDMKNGVSRVSLFKGYILELENRKDTLSHSTDCFINIKGELILQNLKHKEISEFSNDRAFVKIDSWKHSLINKKGEIISTDVFENFIEPGFKNKVAFVEFNNRWGLINTEGEFIIKPQYARIHESGLHDDYFFFQSKGKWGVADLQGNNIIEPILDNFDPQGFSKGLLLAVHEEKLSYFSRKGELVWKGKDKKESIHKLNIDYMNRGYFYAYSKGSKSDIGGFGRSGNKPNSNFKIKTFAKKRVSLIVDMNKVVVENNINRYTVYLINDSSKKIKLSAQDSRLYMKVQALDKSNEWRDIEYLPSSWCGNSYHTLTLSKNKHWKFTTPVYQGDFKTKLRIKLEILEIEGNSENDWESKERIIYSNEYLGSINPGQFWRKQNYYSGGIMDPYND